MGGLISGGCDALVRLCLGRGVGHRRYENIFQVCDAALSSLFLFTSDFETSSDSASFQQDSYLSTINMEDMWYRNKCLLHYLPVTSNNFSRQSPFLKSGFVILAVGSISLLFSISSILVAHVSPPFDPSGLSESVLGFAHISSRDASSSSSKSDTSFWSSTPSSLCSVENWKRKGKIPCASPFQGSWLD